MRAIEPTLTGHYYGGFFTESDATGDIHKYTRGLAGACRRLGVAFRHETDVSSLHHEGSDVRIMHAPAGSPDTEPSSRFDGIVICAGMHSRRFAAQLGDRVNIYPVKGYSVSVNLPDDASQPAAPWVSLLDDSAKVVTSRLGENRFRIAGTAEFNGSSRDIRNDRIEPLVRWCRTHFPAVDTEHVVPWAGLRPMMPDMLPRVGSGRRAGVYYNTGHGHLGWTLSPGHGRTGGRGRRRPDGRPGDRNRRRAGPWRGSRGAACRRRRLSTRATYASSGAIGRCADPA